MCLEAVVLPQSAVHGELQVTTSLLSLLDAALPPGAGAGRALSESSSKIVTKAIFTLQKICGGEGVRSEVCDSNILKKLVELLEDQENLSNVELMNNAGNCSAKIQQFGWGRVYDVPHSDGRPAMSRIEDRFIASSLPRLVCQNWSCPMDPGDPEQHQELCQVSPTESPKRKVAAPRKFDKKRNGVLTAQHLLTTFNDKQIRVSAVNVALMLERADKNADGVLDFTEFVEWLCECRVEERWEEFARQSFAVESMLLLFYKARGFTVQVESLLGTVPELPVPDALQSLDLVELMEATELSPDPIQQALKFREIAAFAKRTAGNCLGLIDSVVRYREKLWKSTEGHRQILGLETNETHSESLVLAGAGQVFGIRLSLEGDQNQYEKARRLAEGYDDWSIKLWNATNVALYHVCKQYGIEVPEVPGPQSVRPALSSLKTSHLMRVMLAMASRLPGRYAVLFGRARLANRRPALMPLYEEKFICPFSIRFSQARIRPTFQDGRDVEASMEEVEAVEAPEGPLKDRYDLLLRAPFPPIEIIRWWPKLREEDGETLLDENGKTILGEPCWFTFDNRRLYCLQAAAIKNWPCRAAAVVHVMHDLPVSKCAPKKFRTTDLGCSVRISRRDDVVPKATWTWMEAAGTESSRMERMTG
ncbi:unnamed protein product [Cladocopium goreaui]|uniref:EF-hand domain-containing protein n=1 Tax=Cladocopium goreaui TaxID=2562237 RepID=A0A9P1CB63_9DINO|nr:unnamed protein product [Cladocopium goreaui]